MTPGPADSGSDDRPGLPGLRTWPALYWVVAGIFVLWIVLLTWLTFHYA